MIDFTNIENFNRELARMCDCYKYCNGCPMYEVAHQKNPSILCKAFCNKYPEEAIPIVKIWSNEHPQALLEKTLLDVMKEKFPKMPEQNIKETCPSFFGLMEKDNCIQYNNCTECWNRSYREEEQK